MTDGKIWLAIVDLRDGKVLKNLDLAAEVNLRPPLIFGRSRLVNTTLFDFNG
jgi:hypothetical protein